MGHISPNIAIIPHLSKNFDEIHYIGSENGIEKEKILSLTKKYQSLSYHSISSTKLDRKNIFKNLSIPFILFRALKESKRLLKKINPCVIFSKGGYVSVPVCIAAGKLNIPLVIHESDLSMGLANRLAKKHASTICTTFPETCKDKNSICTGSPINPALLLARGLDAKIKYNLDPKLKTVCITGGSLGSSAINNAFLKILPTIANKYNIIHLTGKGKKVNFSHKNYHQEEFSDNIGSIFKASDLVVCRAGSNTIFELAYLKKPMLLIPLSKKASRGDQIENASYFKRLKIANVLFEENLANLESQLEKSLHSISELKNNLNKINFPSGTDNLLYQIYKVAKR